MSRVKTKRVTLGSVADFIMGQSPDSKFCTTEQQGIKFLQGCADFGNKYPSTYVYCYKPKKIAPTNSILFSVRAPVGRINLSDQEYCIGRGLAAIVPRSIDRDFLQYSLLSAQGRLASCSQGSTFEAINSEELKSFELTVPCEQKEQTQIAAVLSQVDRAIEQAEALIAKRERIKAGLLHDLLTKGLDEAGNIRSEDTHEFKDSPLGRIPVEWEVLKLECVSHHITSGSRGWARYYSNDGAKFIRIGNLTRRHVNLRFEDVQYVQPPCTSEGKRTSLDVGDLLISITADLGIVGVVPKNLGEAYVNQHIAVVKPDKNQINPWFIGNFLASPMMRKYFSNLNDSGAKAGLNLPTVANILIVCPKRGEQDTIAKVLGSMDGDTVRERHHLTKLQALKIGLMQDLLEGHVSVAPLLNEAE